MKESATFYRERGTLKFFTHLSKSVHNAAANRLPRILNTCTIFHLYLHFPIGVFGFMFPRLILN
jgi:hypothetical protein